MKRAEGYKKFSLPVLALIIAVLAITGYFVVNKLRAANADVNGDGHVNATDLSILASNYGKSGQTFAQGDINGDSSVNILDLSILASNWGATTASCIGVTVPTSQQLNNTYINQHPAGTTYCLQAGTYAVASGGITPQTGDKFIGTTTMTSIINGQNTTNNAFLGHSTSGGSNVTIKNLVIRNFTSIGINSGWGWTIDNNDLSGMGTGATAMEVNDNGVITGNKIHDNQWYAMGGGPTSVGTTVQISNNEVYNNYLCQCHPGDDGATKFHGFYNGGNVQYFNGLTIINNNFHDNQGHGIWLDGPVVGATITGNTVTNNHGAGIFTEIIAGANVANNTLVGNGIDSIGKSCFWSSNILVNNASNITISGNNIDASNGTNGICIVSTDRGDATDPQYAANVSVHDNTVKMATVGGLPANSGLIDGSSVTSPVNVTFNHDTFLVQGSISGNYFAWPPSYPINWTTLKARGQEATGSITAY